MTTDRLQRRIDQMLDEAEQALVALDWTTVTSRAAAVLALQPDNVDAQQLVAAAQRAQPRTGFPPPTEAGVAQAPSPATPTSFANGRYNVRRFLGEGGKKRVYLAHDTLLTRDVAFALIKTDGLDAEGRERITREAQAMGRLGTHPHIVAVFDTGVEGGAPSGSAGVSPAPGSAGILPAGVGQGGGTPYLVPNSWEAAT